MQSEGYLFKVSKFGDCYKFESIGKKGIIKLAISYFHLGNDIWNLAFGTEQEDDLDDEIITNNFDIKKTMETIANSIYDFTDKHPNRKILIRPVDAKREALYNSIFRRKYAEIKPHFIILGHLPDGFGEFDPTKHYQMFLLIRKKRYF